MDNAWISGVFATVGVTVGWVLNQVGVRRADRAAQVRTSRREAQARVYNAAEALTRFAEGVRWLVQIDMGKVLSGESVSHAGYEDVVVDTQSELRRLRESLLAVSIAGSPGAAAELAQLSGQAQQLWNDMLASTRAAIATSPTSMLDQSEHLAVQARSWAQRWSEQ
jgi:hypothetical protein